jgi:hypothetical protein
MITPVTAAIAFGRDVWIAEKNQYRRTVLAHKNQFPSPWAVPEMRHSARYPPLLRSKRGLAKVV